MKSNKLLIVSTVVVFLVAVGYFVYILNASKALSYFSKDPKACINCHVMNTQYATWQHSSHKDIGCVQCHLPTDDFLSKYVAKAKDGWNHSVAFTFGTYENAIRISEDGANRVQKNCISCHQKLVSTLIDDFDKNHNYDETNPLGRKCWECHKSVPHGKVRGLSTTLDNLGVKEVK